jgi:hypothetical protein
MITKSDLPDLVVTAFYHFKTNNRRGDVAHNEDIRHLIEQSTGDPLYDGAVGDIREEILRRRSGLGVEAATMSGSAWRFVK